ncbi:cyclophilin-like fold protein [Anaeromassilibacillus sp. D41t1_190614_C2]|uniref:cyclophilin-like fold protein n=1 Tax=Anaeromassilibacillus sp. D41t1_190614_C2 TaxID=2787078 RepID=UPI001FAD54CC|nr:cyclophilin-like fold protein [Anaeromassilibacillus sp. D41t1_190614_C2]
MKKFLYSIFVGMMILTLSACGTGDAGQSVESTPETLSETGTSSAVLEQSESSESLEVSSVDEVSSDIDIAEEPENTFRQISVQFGENTVVYELNDGTAADSLYEQLPLTIEVEDYSTDEKIFYPPQPLDTNNSPLAQSGAGTLAYYEPWGDIVFFYGDYNENPSLFELGQAVSGGDLVSGMSGTITIDIIG